MLDSETTLALIKKAQQGDERAKEDLIVHNMPLIKSIAARYRGNMTEYEDLIQLGSLGLVKAVNNFNSDYNVRFSTYAVPMIAGEIKRFLRDDGAIKVSRAMKALSAKIKQETDAYRQEHGAAPDIDYLAEKLKVQPQDIVFAMDSSKYPVSLYEKYDDDGSQCVMDRVPDKQDSESVIDRIVLKEVIAALPEREKKVLALRYFKDKTQSEIAEIMGVSQVQISRIENKIIQTLKKAFA